MAVAAGWGGVGAREGPRRALRAPSRGDAFCTFLLAVAALHACRGCACKVPRSALSAEVPPPLDGRGMRARGGRPELFRFLTAKCNATIHM